MKLGTVRGFGLSKLTFNSDLFLRHCEADVIFVQIDHLAVGALQLLRLACTSTTSTINAEDHLQSHDKCGRTQDIEL